MIVHDFPKMSDKEYLIKMDYFQQNQPKTFETAGLVFFCGSLATEMTLRNTDIEKLNKFLKEPPETYIAMEVGITGQQPTGQSENLAETGESSTRTDNYIGGVHTRTLNFEVMLATTVPLVNKTGSFCSCRQRRNYQTVNF